MLLPGKELHLSALLSAKKFRGRGNKDGAVAAFHELAEVGLGTLSTQESRRGTSAVSNVLHYMYFSFSYTCMCMIIITEKGLEFLPPSLNYNLYFHTCT